MKFLTALFYLLTVVTSKETCKNKITPSGCVSFTVAQGTGCAWMCNYCATNLGPNYYFIDNVCVYQNGGCVGNPVAGQTYTCCTV